MAETPGELLAYRSELEREYLRVLSPEIEGFVQDLYARAEGGETLTLAGVLVWWSAAVERAQERLGPDSSILSFMAEHPLPSLALAAILSARSTSAELGDDAATALLRLRTSLGLAEEPLRGMGGSWGRIVSPDGTISWDKSSDTLARTASTADFGDSMLAQLRAEGYTHKRWMTRYDSQVRDTHAAADRQTIPLDESFSVGSTSLRFPGDPMATDLGEVINCRCVLVGVTFGSKYPEPGPENFR